MSNYELYLSKARAAEGHDETVSWTLMALSEIAIVHTQEIEELRDSISSLVEENKVLAGEVNDLKSQMRDQWSDLQRAIKVLTKANEEMKRAGTE